MADNDCVTFLQWALPHLGRRWTGYRKVRRQVCRRVKTRVRELGLDTFAEYRGRLNDDPSEWARLDALTNITISRFHRDRAVFAFLQTDVLPSLLEHAARAGDSDVRAWSAGCASGEEPYTLAIMWDQTIAARAPGTVLQILATDVDPVMLHRAEAARYPATALRELPSAWRDAAFTEDGEDFVLASRFRGQVTVARHDLRDDDPPAGSFDLVLCRNLLFTYFDDPTQRRTLDRIAGVMWPGAALVIGRHEMLPDDIDGFEPWAPDLGVFRRAGTPAGSR